MINDPKVLTPGARASIAPSYANDAAFITAKGSVATERDEYYNSTLKCKRLYDGTNWVSLIDSSVNLGLYYTKDVTVTVGTGKDYDTLSAAVTAYLNSILDDATTVKLVCDSTVTLTENLTIPGLKGTLVIDGDLIRNTTYDSMAGFSFVHGTNPLHYPDDTGLGGKGNITLSTAGNNITVTRATTNPVFTNVLTNGDKLQGVDNSGVWWERTVQSISGGNTIVCTAAAPTMNHLGTGFSILANCHLGSTYSIDLDGPGRLILNGLAAKVKIVGTGNDTNGYIQGGDGTIQLLRGNYDFEARTGRVTMGYGDMVGGARINAVSNLTNAAGLCSNAAKLHSYGNTFLGTVTYPVNITSNSDILLNYSTIVGYYYGLVVGDPVKVYLNNVTVLNTTRGIEARGNAVITLIAATVKNYTIGNYGVIADVGGRVVFYDATSVIDNFGGGLIAANGGLLVYPTGTTISNCTIPVSPSSSGTLGNNGGMIVIV